MKNNNLPEICLSIFAFHLRDELSYIDNLETNAEHLWKKCEELGKKINTNKIENFIDKLKKFNDDIGSSATSKYPSNGYLELLQEKYLTFTTLKSEKKLPIIVGAVYPIQICDAYAVRISLSFEKRPHSNLGLKVKDFKKLNLDNFFLPENIQASLGQTLIISIENDGTITGNNAFNIAQKYINLLLNTRKKQYKLSQGCFLGNFVFEYDNAQVEPGKNLHVLIWIYDDIIHELNHIKPLINLLYYRAKILFAYSESLLDIQHKTIKTSIQNYKLWLQELENLRHQDVQEKNNLDFLKDFPKFLRFDD